MVINLRSASIFKRLLWLCFIYINLISNNSIYGKELVLNDQKIFDFASFLYLRGEYYRAISEYRRLEYFFPDSPLTEQSSLYIGKSYMAGGELQEAIKHWQKQLENIELKNKNHRQIQILIGLSFLDLNKAKTYSLRKLNIKEAFHHFSQISSQSVETKRIKKFSKEWESRRRHNHKSPLIAGTLSGVIPGAGSFYSGRYKEGIYSFFITGLFYLAAREAIRRSKEELAYGFGFFSVAFYIGNIYTAANSAHKINDKMETDELLRLRKKYGIWFIPENDRRKGHF